MSFAIRRGVSAFSQVIIYKGHEQNPLFGPYPDNILKRIEMFECLNKYREAEGKKPWKITPVAGELLVERLQNEPPEETLLVIPAGQSTRLDKVFTVAQTTFLRNEFFNQGGRGYFNCGSAYWVSSRRIYNDLCEEQPETRMPIEKTTSIPLFQGLSEGPLCPFPGHKYKVGFFSDAVDVTDGKNECTIYLSGGGCFRPEMRADNGEKVTVLARYLHSELQRLGKTQEECKKWENAVIMTSVGKGAALLSMFHPYYGAKDINVDVYEQTFPESGTNWRAIKERLSPLDVRMRFVLGLISRLENKDFS